MKKGFMVMWAVFVLLILAKLFGGSPMLPALIVFVWSAALSVYLLAKNGLPSKKGLAVSAALTAAVLTVGITLMHNGIAGTAIFTTDTLLASLAVISVSEKTDVVKLAHSENAGSLLMSALIGMAVAVPLSVINTVGNTGASAAPAFEVSRLVMAIHPGIAEDMAFRAVFMAFCVYSAGEKMTKPESFTMYIMMMFPHGLMHDMNIPDCVAASLIFGLAFTLLQRKRDVTSAMVSHFTVDAVRFVIFGG